MGTVTLLLGIHNHQPQGNFDEVFARGYADCYRRLVDAIARHPAIHIALHHSGPLIEWLESHHPDYFDDVARLADAGQVEVLGGGFYEPMLSVLPERDAAGQLRMMADFIAARFGRRPQGMWLAERVWEPDLARVIADGGYRYTLLDDGHFVGAGLRRPLRGHYVTDKGGRPLSLFPIAKELRYAIPFSPAEEAIEMLQRIADEAEDEQILTYGDDGEKFGMWPHTKEWVWEKGWLDRFFELLAEQGERIRTATFSEVLGRTRALGRVYLPTASYDEMGEWSLPAEAQPDLEALTERIDSLEEAERWRPFVRGGIWQGFLAKYPESNFMHKRMCLVSDKVAAAERALGGDAVADARRELYRGQCNCAYWHGLFGGLYSPKLRAAVHSHLIRAEALCRALATPGESSPGESSPGESSPGESSPGESSPGESSPGESSSGEPVAVRVADIDGDFSPEVAIDAPLVGLLIAPDRGGAALAIDHRQLAFQVNDVLTRRPEAYHAKIRELAAKQAAGGTDDTDAPKSIHDIAELKDETLAEALVYDPHQRLSFVDHFLAGEPGAALAALARCEPDERGDFVDAFYGVAEVAGGARGRAVLGRKGKVRTAGGEHLTIRLAKRFEVGAESADLTVDYEVELAGAGALAEELHFATELTLALPSGPHPDGRLEIVSDSKMLEAVTARGQVSAVTNVALVDPFTPLAVRLKVEPAATLAFFPLESASQSESGFERTYQGTVLVLAWPCAGDAPLRPRLTLTLA